MRNRARAVAKESVPSSSPFDAAGSGALASGRSHPMAAKRQARSRGVVFRSLMEGIPYPPRSPGENFTEPGLISVSVSLMSEASLRTVSVNSVSAARPSAQTQT